MKNKHNAQLFIQRHRILILTLLIAMLNACAKPNQVTLVHTDDAEDESVPRLISVKPPVYPKQLWEAGVQGYVNVSYSVNENGKVVNLKVIDEYPAQVFREAALKSVKSSRYEPGKKDNQPVLTIGITRRVAFLIDDNISNKLELQKLNCSNSTPEWVDQLNCEKIQ
jgi:TonB family protein